MSSRLQDPRNSTIALKLSDIERAHIVRAAALEGLTMSAFARDILVPYAVRLCMQALLEGRLDEEGVIHE